MTQYYYLLDTNILSEPLKPEANANVVNRLLQQAEHITTAAPVIYEIVKGAKRLPESKKRTEIFRYLDEFVYPQVPILPYDKRAAILHGHLQATLSLKGQTAPLIDSQIAAIAQVNQLILVTRNISDFQGFEDLKLENWFVHLTTHCNAPKDILGAIELTKQARELLKEGKIELAKAKFAQAKELDANVIFGDEELE